MAIKILMVPSLWKSYASLSYVSDDIDSAQNKTSPELHGSLGALQPRCGTACYDVV